MDRRIQCFHDYLYVSRRIIGVVLSAQCSTCSVSALDRTAQPQNSISLDQAHEIPGFGQNQGLHNIAQRKGHPCHYCRRIVAEYGSSIKYHVAES